jgi:hypothetical protein
VNAELKAIWTKVMAGEALNEQEQTAWNNFWCEDHPVRVV